MEEVMRLEGVVAWGGMAQEAAMVPSIALAFPASLVAEEEAAASPPLAVQTRSAEPSTPRPQG